MRARATKVVASKPVRRHLQPPPAASANWAFFIDLDGTLVDIADSPAGITIDATLPELLDQLRHACNGAVALVSGRTLADLDRHLHPLLLPAAGQHGLEHRKADGSVIRREFNPDVMNTLRTALAPVIERHSGLLLEDKGASLALHYRRQPRLAPYLHRLMHGLAAALSGLVELQPGKCVIEVRPAGWHKGTAITGFLAEFPFRSRQPVFIGDDITDENGFTIINAMHGLSIKVGPGRTTARHRLPDVGAVLAWLSTIAREKE